MYECRGANGAGNTLSCLSEVLGQSVPDLDAKPVWHNVLATVVSFNADQAMWYLANPENNKKVGPSVA